MYISSRLSGQYLVQSLLEYWVHTLSLVLSVKPAPAVSLHSVTMTAGYTTVQDNATQYTTVQCSVSSPGPVHQVPEVAVVGAHVQHRVPAGVHVSRLQGTRV